MRLPFAISLLALAATACDGDGPADAGRDAGPDAGPPDAGPPVIVLPDDREPCGERNPLRNAYFGDLHVHTAISFDANAYGTRTRPRDAYRFARGEPIGLPPYDADGEATRTVQLERPLDFAAVTDHAEFFGEIDICTDPSSPGYDSTTCRTYREGDSAMPDYGELTNLLFMPGLTARVCRQNPGLCEAREATVWQEIQDAAEEFQDRSAACGFTTFVGYEWTASEGGTNLHRNVLFRGRSVQRVPVSFLDAPTAEAFWARLETTCLDTDTPCDLLAIPHNGNLGGGGMFVPAAEDGSPYDRADAARRARIEPLVEIYQHKGASECIRGLDHPLASEDELCDFEMFHPNLCTGAADDPDDCVGVCEGGSIGFLGGCVGPGDFARGTLRTGLAEWARVGANPFQLGFIGSTDTHVATSGLVREEGWPGHAGENEDEPADQLQVPDGALVRGRTASPGGLAVIWAEENSREALFDAMRRRETYATSGPRIVARFFGGWGYPSDLCETTDPVATADADGVPMGGVLPPRSGDGAPVFFVSALRDALGAPLQRIQVVKGWLEAGETRERVYEIAGDPDNGATVDEATCAPMGDGFDALCETWTDPDFDPSAPAFWYARVVENPTCRWTRHACNALAPDCDSIDAGDPLFACCDPSIDQTIQERAWTSPIWYEPG
ncbi:MAG TPA: DUF3604 domain-containing protein [Sandaracinaceae bacterium LLY-WYZ-13_1]|nr:DUF3604 domain-containing protein [Sandaracinaceae bacterium LLY-WYZ-13_1]